MISPAVLAGVVLVLGAQPALAAGSVSVSQTVGLPAAGAQVTVTGSGFDETIGIYVAVCVDNGPDQLPTPCIGGVDTSGGAGSSAWISSDPPSYAEGLTTPYGPGGSFEVTLTVVASDPKTGVDCRQVSCAVVTRSDHTRTDDRSQDTRTPLTFAADGAAASTQPPSSQSQSPTPSEPGASGEPVALSTTSAGASSTPAAAPTTASTTDARTIAASAAEAPADGLPGWVWGAVAVGLAAVVLILLRLRSTATRGNIT